MEVLVQPILVRLQDQALAALLVQDLLIADHQVQGVVALLIPDQVPVLVLLVAVAVIQDLVPLLVVVTLVQALVRLRQEAVVHIVPEDLDLVEGKSILQSKFMKRAVSERVTRLFIK